MSNFTLSAFADEISPDLSEQISVLKQHDIPYVELRSVDGRNILDHSIAEVKLLAKRLMAEGIQVSALGSPIGKIGIEEPFEPHLGRFKKALEIANILATANIRMFSFYIPAEDDPTRYRDEVIRRWQAFVEAARGTGIKLLHENESGIYGETPERCLDLIESLEVDFVRATFDPANFVLRRIEVFPHAYRLLEKHIHYIHIKDALLADGKVVPAGEGDGKVDAVLKALVGRDFQGFLSIEPHLNNNQPGGGPRNFAVAVAALRRLLKAL